MSADPLATDQPGAPGSTDTAAQAQSGSFATERFTATSATPGAANEMAETVEAVEAAAPGGSSKEDIGRYTNVVNQNPSTYAAGGNVLNDLAAAETDAEADAPASRVWGEHIAAVANAASATAVGAEIDVTNNTGSTDTTPLSQGAPGQTVGMRLMADGQNPVDAAEIIGQGGGRFQEGIVVASGAVAMNRPAIDMETGELVLGAGTALIAKLPNGAEVIFGYVNSAGWLVLGGPGIPNVVAWSQSQQQYVSIAS